ncbi:hypothetical protein WOLCODRAFT_84767 [Wolfiporia cocos MD-104 SS10]|uniref:Uncharacterized protein n=1 Tax=Wolfiporia cocos (strain MD-104) TaxID=742152 RepID=A0A2H3J9A4_WOLCO|nr:hypothetical protein WOLCODRAFT_84767 [Wolfiporia cocos MD-104 SS10]
MPNSSVQVFKLIVVPPPEALPIYPPPRSMFLPSTRLMQDWLNRILESIPAGFLRHQEIDLLVWVLNTCQQALAWTDAECGTFSAKYFPNYEIPIIEHVP